jgi:uncharacterized protein (DUF1330 family)
MTRYFIDCREMPSESNCTLTISGEPEEVLRAATQHAVDVHGHADSAELRAGIQAQMKETGGAPTTPGAFVQVIEYRTDQPDEYQLAVDKWRERMGGRTTVRWAMTGEEHNDPGHFMEIVEFPNYEQAMRNSRDPETSELADRLRSLSTGKVVFHDLDVVAAERV